MTQPSLFAAHWYSNTLLDEGFVQQKMAQLAGQPVAHGLDAWLAQHFQPASLADANEAQLENGFIRPLLEQLGWQHIVPQQSITVQGKLAKPDWCLALDANAAQAIMAGKPEGVTAICEAKGWDKLLDTGKASREHNPHHQLQDYLATLRIRFGFLTNGRLWRLYDTDRITAQKTYLEFDLQRITALEDAAEKHAALALFAFFFGRDTYAPLHGTDAAQPGSAIERAIAESSDFTLAVEENLKAVIYGTEGEESLFELMGKAIHKANAAARPDLEAVYENSVILLFRLLFVVYFEDKNRALLDSHPFYNQHSLHSTHQRLRQGGSQRAALHDGVHALKQLFEMLDKGAEDIDIPLFNGGLFDPLRAPLLRTPKIFSNTQLQTILEKLLFKTHRGQTLFDTRRDFKNMSVTHLGRIYEGLLEFRFERAHESATYLEYVSSASGNKPVEAYFDAYDAASIKTQKGFRALREVSVKKGDIYLKSASNSRKSSASYYTPQSLSERLVRAGIASALEQGRALVDIKILDNACGSGHFLVEALGRLTDLALAQLEHDGTLQQLVLQERAKITGQLQFLNLRHEPDDAQILKRALLKRCIYGVDLNPFAVELARLSLWMDSFIFGTPLSFIEHHVQHGNALMGASVADFIAYNTHDNVQNDLFVDDLRSRFDELASVMQELAELRDTTAEEVAQSKKLWQQSIAPRLALLSRALSFISTRAVLLAENKQEESARLDKTPGLLDLLFSENRNTGGKNAVLRLVEEHSARWHFFHYEVAFPEVFAGERRGFDAIIGNPPWDKTKFSDTDFFPQYHSNYRSLKNTEKAAVQKRLLESQHIADAWKQAAQAMETANNYYKNTYPLNKGAGDGNLFRFFVERNLGLLAEGGSLNYVLPSALMFEEGSQALRQHIFTRFRMRFFHSFENRNGIFPDVDSRYKFALMQIVRQPPDPAAPIDTAFYVLDAAELNDPERRIPYPLDTLRDLSPTQLAMMELRNADDLRILAKCYAAFDPLRESWLDFRNELHMTNDKSLFIEQHAPGLLPLVEGKTIWQYSHRLAEPQYWLEPQAFDEQLRSKEIYRMAQDLGVKRKVAEKHAASIRYDREFVRLGFRDIARDTDERTLIFALLPPDCGVGNTINISVPKRYIAKADGMVGMEPVSPLRLLFALAWFNSLPADWIARFMIQIHANKTYLYRLPTPQPGDDEIRASKDYTQLARNALLLTLAASRDDFAPLAPLFNLSPADVPTTAKAKDRLRAENDRIVCRFYGISQDELAHMLESFKVMADKRPEYLTLLQ